MAPIRSLLDHLDEDERATLLERCPEFEVCERVLPLYGMPACRIGPMDFADMELSLCEKCPHDGPQGVAAWIAPSRFRER